MKSANSGCMFHTLLCRFDLLTDGWTLQTRRKSHARILERRRYVAFDPYVFAVDLTANSGDSQNTNSRRLA